MEREVSLAKRLQVIRLERGLTLRQAEEVTGVDKGTISKIERGQSHPYGGTLARLAKGYSVPLVDLVDEPTLAGAPGKADAQATGQQESGQPEDSLPMPEPSGHAHQVGIHETDRGTEVTYTKKSFFEVVRELKRQGVISAEFPEEDAWQRSQKEAS